MDLSVFILHTDDSLPPDSHSRHVIGVCGRNDEWMEGGEFFGDVLWFCVLFSVVTVILLLLSLLLKLLALPAFASDPIPLCPGLWGQTLPAWWGAKSLGSEAAHPRTPSHGGPQRERGGAAFYLLSKLLLPPRLCLLKTLGRSCFSNSEEPGKISQRC